MRLHRWWCRATAACVAGLAIGARAAEEPAPDYAFAGVWKIARVDNVPADLAVAGERLPPRWFALDEAGGVSAYWDDRTRAWVPQPAGARAKLLALWARADGVAKFVALTPKRFEIIDATGAVNAFRRVAGDPAERPVPDQDCIAYTVRGTTYSERAVAELQHLEDEELPDEAARRPELWGRWAARPSLESRIVITLTLAEPNVIASAVELGGTPSPGAATVRTDTYAIRGGTIVSRILNCGAPARLRVAGDTLVLETSDAGTLAFRRMRARANQ